jgi:plastocyanin
MLFIVLYAVAAASVIAAPRTPASAIVHLKDDAFTPPSIVVPLNTTVTFVNDDDDAHTVTSTDGLFDSKGLDSHQRWTHTFTKAGTYQYFCTLHPFMKGTVVVKGAHS